jgi:RNA polymerase-binding transcription factor DksA
MTETGSTLDLTAQRARLEELRAELREQYGEAQSDEQTIADTTLPETYNQGDEIDAADAMVTTDEEAATVAHDRARLLDIEAALERLDAGTYGWCLVDKKWIGDERLTAEPSTPYCIDDARAQQA